MSTVNLSAAPASSANSTPAMAAAGNNDAGPHMVPASDWQNLHESELRILLAAASTELAAWHAAFPFGSPSAAAARVSMLQSAACDTAQVVGFLLTTGVEDLDRAVIEAMLKRILDLALGSMNALDDMERDFPRVLAKAYPWHKDSGVVL